MGRRFRRRPSATFWLLILIVAAVASRALLFRSPDTPILSPGDAQVVSIDLDGTLQISEPSNGKAIPVHLIGVVFDTDNRPARGWLLERLQGNTVRIELDKRRRDSNGKALAYVYRNGQCINAELLRRGLAHYVPYPGDSTAMTKLLRAAAEEWRAANHTLPGSQESAQR